MKLWVPIIAVVAAFGLAMGSPVLAQAPEDPLPDAPGKAVVARVCAAACHDATQFAYARHTPDEWGNEIGKMQMIGAEMTAEDQTAIWDYLVANFPRPAPTSRGR